MKKIQTNSYSMKWLNKLLLFGWQIYEFWLCFWTSFVKVCFIIVSWAPLQPVCQGWYNRPSSRELVLWALHRLYFFQLRGCWYWLWACVTGVLWAPLLFKCTILFWFYDGEKEYLVDDRWPWRKSHGLVHREKPIERGTMTPYLFSYCSFQSYSIQA